MKIGIDARMYGQNVTTGIGSYIKNLIDQLALIDQKNEYVLFMKEPAYSEFVLPSKKFKKVKVNLPWYSLEEQIKFPWILLKENLDIMHFPHFNAAIFYPKKIFITIHDITPKFFPGPNARKSKIRKFGYDFVFRLALWRAKKIITISEHTKNNILKYFKVSKEKIFVTYLGLDSNIKQISDQNLLANFKNKYNITKPYLFYVGVWRDHKNLPALVAAFNILKEEFKYDCQLVLGGKPDPRYPEILEKVNQSQFKNDIILPGFVADDELSLFYSAAKLFVLPSFCEGFGLVAIESIAAGVPVAASNTTSLPEILENNAIFFDPNDYHAIASLIFKNINDQKAYESLKNNGQTYIKRFSWAKCAQQTLDVYQSR